MSRSVLHTLLVCLLLLAVPIQGLATAGMVMCAVSHQRTAGTGDGLHMPCHSDSGDGIGHPRLPGGHQGDPASDDAVAAGNPAPAPCDNATSTDNGSCSACAVCCVGAVLMPPRVTVAAAPLGNAIFPPPATLGPSFQADVPVRPPRHA